MIEAVTPSTTGKCLSRVSSDNRPLTSKERADLLEHFSTMLASHQNTKANLEKELGAILAGDVEVPHGGKNTMWKLERKIETLEVDTIPLFETLVEKLAIGWDGCCQHHNSCGDYATRSLLRHLPKLLCCEHEAHRTPLVDTQTIKTLFGYNSYDVLQGTAVPVGA